MINKEYLLVIQVDCAGIGLVEKSLRCDEVFIRKLKEVLSRVEPDKCLDMEEYSFDDCRRFHPLLTSDDIEFLESIVPKDYAGYANSPRFTLYKLSEEPGELN
jgi:hypothetical protein